MLLASDLAIELVMVAALLLEFVAVAGFRLLLVVVAPPANDFVNEFSFELDHRLPIKER